MPASEAGSASAGPGAVWPGWYYDGRSAARRQVSITVTAGGLRIVGEDGEAMLWPFASLRQTQGRHDREQLRIEFGSEPAQALSVVQPGLAEAIRAAAPDARDTLRERTPTARVLMWSFAGIR